MAFAPPLLHRLGLREPPDALEDFLARSVHANRVVPARHDREVVRHVARTSEPDRVRTVRVRLGSQVVQQVGVKLVLLEVALGVVDTRFAPQP
jgi:hypothetical protein